MTEKTMVEKAWERVNRWYAGDSSITEDQLAYAWGFIEGYESQEKRIAELEKETERLGGIIYSREEEIHHLKKARWDDEMNGGK
jgi:hypothetical protein